MNLEQVEKMSDEELRIKVAELRGWNGVIRSGSWIIGWTDKPSEEREIPDFSQDLNAMYEVEKDMTEKEYNKYCDMLWNMCHGASGKSGAIHASARQRAEAFVMAMEKS